MLIVMPCFFYLGSRSTPKAAVEVRRLSTIGRRLLMIVILGDINIDITAPLSECQPPLHSLPGPDMGAWGSAGIARWAQVSV